MFESLVAELYETLPDFGRSLAIDSKAIPSFANGKIKMKKKMAAETRMQIMG
jgi:hypothetical protein